MKRFGIFWPKIAAELNKIWIKNFHNRKRCSLSVEPNIIYYIVLKRYSEYDKSMVDKNMVNMGRYDKNTNEPKGYTWMKCKILWSSTKSFTDMIQHFHAYASGH